MACKECCPALHGPALPCRALPCPALCFAALWCSVLPSPGSHPACPVLLSQYMQPIMKGNPESGNPLSCRRLQDAAQHKTATSTEPEPKASVQEQHEGQIALMALTVLVGLTGNAGCVEALAEERALLLCYWLVHRPPRLPHLLLALRLLHTLAATPPAAWAAAAQAGVVYLLALLLPADPPLPPFKVEHSIATVVVPLLIDEYHAAPTSCLGWQTCTSVMVVATNIIIILFRVNRNKLILLLLLPWQHTDGSAEVVYRVFCTTIF